MSSQQAQNIAEEVAKIIGANSERVHFHKAIDPYPDIVKYDPVQKPIHYNKHPSGIECIQITEHMGFCIGNAMKYLWRADLKGGIEDLNKAIWYIQREISKRTPKENSDDTPRRT